VSALLAMPAPVATGLVLVLAAVTGYAVGSVNPAAIFARVRGTDLREVGSGNPGATNAGRAFGWRVGVLVALLDMLKGFLPVVAFEALGLPEAGLVAGVAAVLGHVTSPFLRGRGGKGVATSLGAILAVQPWWAVIALAVFGATFALTRRVGLASVAAALALVPAALWLHSTTAQVVFAVALAVVVVARHRRNLASAFARAKG
jgi:glycerol-3-phosphate acyltransferase PlsY